MTTYDDLLIEADNNNLITKEKPLRANKGRIKGNRIAIKKDLTETEKNVFWQRNSDTTTPLWEISSINPLWRTGSRKCAAGS